MSEYSVLQSIVYMLYKAQLKLPYLQTMPLKYYYYKAGKVCEGPILRRE